METEGEIITNNHNDLAIKSKINPKTLTTPREHSKPRLAKSSSYLTECASCLKQWICSTPSRPSTPADLLKNIVWLAAGYLVKS